MEGESGREDDGRNNAAEVGQGWEKEGCLERRMERTGDEIVVSLVRHAVVFVHGIGWIHEHAGLYSILVARKCIAHRARMEVYHEESQM